MIGRAAAFHLLRSFERRNYRYFWLSDAFTGWAEQMEFVVLVWFVLIETDSPFLVGLFGSLRFTGTLFSPFYGILADRYDRRKLLIAVRTAFAVNSTLILLLILTDVLQVWHVFVLVGVTGMGRAFDNVARQSLLPDMVERAQLANAVALNRTARDLTQILGPVTGGFVRDNVGMGTAYMVIVAIYALGTLGTLRVKAPPRAATAARVSVVRDLTQIGRYIRGEQAVLALLLMAFLVNLTGFPLNQGLLPVFAREVLNTSSSGLGVLLGAYSAGGLLGSLVIAGLPQFRRPGLSVMLGSIGWHAAILAVSQMRWFSASIPVLALAGIAQSFTMVTMSMMLLSATSPELRGRVMGIRSLAVYGLPVGLLFSGAVADAFGAPAALAVNAFAGIAFTMLVWLRYKLLTSA